MPDVHFHFSLSCIGEGNGNPLQCSCLENPRDWGAWWAAIYGVTQCWTWLKWLSSNSSSIHPRVQFPNSWMRENGLAPEHLFQTEAQCQSVDRGSEVGVTEDSEAASGGQGAVTVGWCSWVLGSGLGVVDHLPHSCWDTEDLRGLAHWNVPSFGFCGMRSGT